MWSNERVLQWVGHVERMVNDRIAKRVYVGSCLISNPWKRWVDSLNDFKKKKEV